MSSPISGTRSSDVPAPARKAPETPATIWDRTRLGITLGSVALIFLAGLESLAVTTVMPIIAADLHGEALFALAFSGTLATSVIGMVAAGIWSDRGSVKATLCVAVLVFMIGLVVSGVATDMYTFIVGRLIQGLGAGGQIVALYVDVARVYPRNLQGKVFAAFAAGWVLPSLAGPFLAGAVAEFLHWRWVFLGVAIITVLALFLVLRSLRHTPFHSTGEENLESRRKIWLRLSLSVITAASVVAVGFAADAPSVLGWIISAGCILLLACAIRPLLPSGTLRLRAGLPSVILTRGLLAGSFLAAETFIPKLLMDDFAFSPTTAGLALTAAALTWTLGSFAHGRYGETLGSLRLVMISFPLVFAGIAALFFVSVFWSAPWLIVVGWGVAGMGMGLFFPRLTVLTLGYSQSTNEGFNSSALAISDSTGSAVAIAVAGLAFLTLPIAGSGFPTVFIFAALVLVIALIPALRIGNAQSYSSAKASISYERY